MTTLIPARLFKKSGEHKAPESPIHVLHEFRITLIDLSTEFTGLLPHLRAHPWLLRNLILTDQNLTRCCHENDNARHLARFPFYEVPWDFAQLIRTAEKKRKIQASFQFFNTESLYASSHNTPQTKATFLTTTAPLSRST